MYTYQYPRPSVTTDVIIYRKNSNSEFEVVIITRGNDPFKGCYAFPGGYLDLGEYLRQCAVRETMEEVGLKIDSTQLLPVGVFDEINRHPGDRVISHAFMVEWNTDYGEIKAGDDAKKVEWMLVKDLLLRNTRLAFDHYSMLMAAHMRM